MDVNGKTEEGFTPLMAASGSGHDQVVRMLLSRDADINLAGPAGFTCLHAANDNGYPQVANLLMERRAQSMVQGGAEGTPTYQ